MVHNQFLLLWLILVSLNCNTKLVYSLTLNFFWTDASDELRSSLLEGFLEKPSMIAFGNW